MSEIFIYLSKKTERYYYLENHLSFEIAGIQISFGFESDESIRNNDDINLQELQMEKLTKITLSDYEYIGDRKDINIYSPPTVLSDKLFWFVKAISEKYPVAIDNYRVDLFFGDIMCSSEPNYLFEIEINRAFLNNTDFFDYIISLKYIDEQYIPPKAYWNAFQQSNKRIFDNFELKILSTNTKVRRLGYFKILFDFFEYRQRVPEKIINKKFEEYSIQHLPALKTHKNDKGEIKKTKTGNSAKPYIELAADLELIYKLNDVYSKNKQIKVYDVLKLQYETKENPFQLQILDKLFFLEVIIKQDYIYLYTLMELIYLDGNTSYAVLKNKFQDCVIKNLSSLIGSNSEIQKCSNSFLPALVI